jgi:phosphotransferase family enzyme
MCGHLSLSGPSYASLSLFVDISANFAKSRTHILQFLALLQITLRSAMVTCLVTSHMDLFLITPLSAFYNRELDIAKKVTYPGRHDNAIPCAPPDTEPFDDSRPLVFTHADLSMRNIIFGRDGRIWLVDWDWSGFFPPWFEYVSMVYAAENDKAPGSWNYLIPFIADPLFKHMKWIGQLGVALIAYR